MTEKTRCTIGIMFSKDMERVVLILKNRPVWQAGKFNFPGGHNNPNESDHECISREFEEECGVITDPHEWLHIGTINGETYSVGILTMRHDPESHMEITTAEDQLPGWYQCNDLPYTVISNLNWLVPFAQNFFNQGVMDALCRGEFYYENVTF